MNKEEHRWHWKCTDCGKESPSSVKHCPRCNALLAIHGVAIPDDPEPDMPRKPFVVDWEAEQSRYTDKQQRKKERKTKEKDRNHAGLVILIVLLILVILALGAAVLVLLDSETANDPTQTSIVQTTSTITAPSSPPTGGTQPVQTAPVADPADTTEPPAADQTETTAPPVTDPVITDPALAPNTLEATIFGRKEIFYLSKAYVGDYEVDATYYAYNPRGEERYYLSLSFDKNLFEGTYQTNPSILYTVVKVSFSKMGDYDFYTSYPGLDTKDYQIGTFVIEKISDDWMTYDGSFQMTLYLDNGDTIVIDDAVFNFTLD